MKDILREELIDMIEEFRKCTLKFGKPRVLFGKNSKSNFQFTNHTSRITIKATVWLVTSDGARTGIEFRHQMHPSGYGMEKVYLKLLSLVRKAGMDGPDISDIMRSLSFNEDLRQAFITVSDKNASEIELHVAEFKLQFDQIVAKELKKKKSSASAKRLIELAGSFSDINVDKLRFLIEMKNDNFRFFRYFLNNFAGEVLKGYTDEELQEAINIAVTNGVLKS
jgi:hypothetical protein